MKRLVAALVIATLGVLAFIPSASADGPTQEELARRVSEQQLKLGPGEKSKSMRLANGVIISLVDETKEKEKGPKKKDSANSFMAQASYSYYTRQCSVKVTSSYGAGAWQLTQHTTFHYDYYSVWHSSSAPRPLTRASYPYSWSGQGSAHNDWSQTVKFTDGWGRLKFAPTSWPYTETTWVGYIGHDAWGNCWVGGYQS